MINAIEPAVDPKNRIDFLIDWEVTLKCNLDCSYCVDNPISGGHWTLAKHPPLNKCLDTIDFMYEYTDLYMKTKPNYSRRSVLNVYGGESLLHPNIVEILAATRSKHQGYNWPLTITTTTNAIIGKTRMLEIIPFIDEFTLSYHSESLPKQKQQFKENTLLIKEANVRHKVLIMMSTDYTKWTELLELIDWCKDNNVRYLAKQVDGGIDTQIYNEEQLAWFKKEYTNRSSSKQAQEKILNDTGAFESSNSLTEKGRSCCGGRSLCVNNNHKQRLSWVPYVNFKDWYCTVNQYFMFIKQNNGDVYINKDCRMRFDGTVGPIGNLNNWQDIIHTTSDMIDSKSLSVIKCAKSRCLCGLCSPKAVKFDDLQKIMEPHLLPGFKLNSNDDNNN